MIGEPEFDDPDAIKLPEQGPLSYSFTVEVRPEFTLPDVSNLKVRKPKIEIRDENVDQAMRNLREQQGALVPVEDRGVQEGDYLFADVHIKVDGNVIAHEHDTQLVSRSGKLVGIQVDDLPQQLAEMKPGETRTITAHAPDTHPGEALRGKDVQIEITLKDIKHLELAEINQAFMEDLGFENEQELRDALREQMEQKISDDIQQAMREQVNRYLLENTQFELPERLSTKQADRVVSRRAVNLMMRGVPREQVEANIEQLRGGDPGRGRPRIEAVLYSSEARRAAGRGCRRSRTEWPHRDDRRPAATNGPSRLEAGNVQGWNAAQHVPPVAGRKSHRQSAGRGAQVEEVNVEEGQKKE